MRGVGLLLAFAAAASAFTISTPLSNHATLPERLAHKMQVLVPEGPTITKPDALPETWVVPDTFMPPRKQSAEPPMYRVTLFKSSRHDATYISAALSKVCGFDEVRAREIAVQAQSLGFAVVIECVQEVAEMYAAGLRASELVVDVSAVKVD